MNSDPLHAGERALLIDQRGRTYLVMLQEHAQFHFHGGVVEHDAIIGLEQGAEVRSASDALLWCLRPRLADFVLKMKRGAQVVYPKDLGPILVYTDIFPGARVLEAGTGSGSLCMALCRAVGEGGRVVSYELREEHASRGRKNIEAFFGEVPRQLDLRDGDIREAGDGDERFDRLVLDMPEPWGVLESVEPALETGAIVCGYVPTTIQVQEMVMTLRARGYGQVETIETMHRTWHVEQRSVRPDHRMVGHTGFLSIGRHTGSAVGPESAAEHEEP